MAKTSRTEAELMSYVERPSRAQKKRDLAKLCELAAVIISLPQGKFVRLTLPEILEAPIIEARRLTDPNARRRQLRFVQSLMEPDDMAPILANLERIGHALPVTEWGRQT